MPEQDTEAIGADYVRFADEEARGRSPLYEGFAPGVAEAAELLRRLSGLPPGKRQPNLLLAAVRHVAGLAADQAAFPRAALGRWPEVRAAMLARATQTAAQASILRVFVDHCLALHLRGQLSVDRAAAAKLVASEMRNRLLDEFLQIYGGYGYMAEYPIGRAWADARLPRIYGGSSEIM